MTLKQAVESHEILTFLVKADEKEPFLPFKTRLMINTRLRKLRDDNANFNEQKLALFQEYGSPIIKENQLEGYSGPTDPEKIKEFNEKMTLLLESEGDVYELKPLPIASLGEANKLSASFLQFMQDSGVLEQTPEELG